MRNIKYLVWFLCIIALFALGALYITDSTRRNVTGIDTSMPIATSGEIGGAFTLTDHHGNTVTDQSWPGKFLILYFGFTHCPDVCPTGLNTIIDALNQLPAKDSDNVQPLLITVDPARDTPAVLKEYVALFHPRLTGLTGTEGQIETMKKLFRVYAQKQGEDKDYMVNHSAYTYFLNPKGELAGLFGHDITAKEMATEIQKRIAE